MRRHVSLAFGSTRHRKVRRRTETSTFVCTPKHELVAGSQTAAALKELTTDFPPACVAVMAEAEGRALKRYPRVVGFSTTKRTYTLATKHVLGVHALAPPPPPPPPNARAHAAIRSGIATLDKWERVASSFRGRS